ncbi:MAG: glycosyltransferase family 4 protein [Vulcanimicrobiota bacterium]
MRIWLVKDGEQLPVLEGARPQRIWLLAAELARRGHQVTWWSSTHSHQKKLCVSDQDGAYAIEPGFELRLLHAGGYQRNISLGRVLHHLRLARRFRQVARQQPPPEMILCCHPIPALGLASIELGRRHRLPVVIDIRDIWPDIFLRRVPLWAHPLVELLIWPWRQQARSILRPASGLTAISKGLLDWGLDYAGRPAGRFDRVFVHGYRHHDPASPGQAPEVLASLDDKTIFAFAGTIGGSYDVPFVIEVARQLWQAGERRVHFLLAGLGEQRELCLKKAEGLPNVSLPGWLERDTLVSVLRRCQVGLLPWGDGHPDAMPNKPFEYMAAGLPILSSCVGELEHLLEQQQLGFYYPAGDHQALARLVSRLTDQPELRQAYAGRARRAFEEQYNDQAVYGGFADYLEELLRSKTQ